MSTDQGTHTTNSWLDQLSIIYIKEHAPPTLHWDHIKHHLDTLTLLLSFFIINLGWNNCISIHDWTYLKKILNHACYWLLAVYSWIFHMECFSGSTTVLDRRSRPSDTQQHHWEDVHSLLLQWLCPAPATCWSRSIIWSLWDHIKWCLWMGTCI